MYCYQNIVSYYSKFKGLRDPKYGRSGVCHAHAQVGYNSSWQEISTDRAHRTAAGKFYERVDQGSQTHLSMWAAVEDNSQSAGRTTKCNNVLRNTVLTAVES